MMRYLIGILLSFLLFQFSSCTDEEIEEKTAPAASEKVTFRMGVTIPEMEKMDSRSFCDYPEIQAPLWVVVFDREGYLLEYSEASNFQKTKLQDGTDVVKFDVVLTPAKDTRILHFLLGYGEQPEFQYGHEYRVIGDLKVAEGRDVYWQRYEIYSLSFEDVERELQKISLIRNFAKITISNDDPTFIMDSYYVAHAPKSGTVAPYNDSHFESFKRGKNPCTYQYLIDKSYQCSLPDEMEYEVFTSDETKWKKPDEPTFLYEHRLTENPEEALFVLVKGKYQNETSYYKIDLANYSAEEGLMMTYHVFRNFHYDIKISEVCEIGKATAQEAYDLPANNNLSASVLLRNMLGVSDGISALYVSYTDTVLVSTDPVQLKYKYVFDINDDDLPTCNQEVKYKLEKGDIFAAGGITNNVLEGGWASLTLTPKNEMPSYPIRQSLTVYHKNSKLSRRVVFELRPKLQMELECVDKVVPESGSEVNVVTNIPKYLNENLFPLVFSYESQDKNNPGFLMQYLSPKPDEKMYAVLGNSLVPGFEGVQSFHYERVLTFQEYQDLQVGSKGDWVSLPCTFVTNRDKSASIIYVDSKYFVKASASFDN